MIMKPSYLLFKKTSVWNTLVVPVSASRLPLCPSEAGHFFALPGYAVRRDFHNSFLLLFSINGAGLVKTAQGEYTLSPGEAAVIDCHMPHSYSNRSGDWEFLWMHFSGPFAEAFAESLKPCAPEKCAITDTEHFRSVFLDIINALNTGGTYNLLKINRMMSELFFRLFADASRPAYDSETDALIRHATEFIDENYGSDITVKELSKHFGLSEYHFIRSFKRVTGVPPYTYLISRRIAEAKRMLAMSSSTVAEIAVKCGFADSAAFIAGFKNRTGTTPMWYRKDFSK